MTEVRIEGLVKTYGSTHALDNVSLTFPEGSFFGLLGPSGSGKTTLLRAIAGFVVPESGRVFFDDEPVETMAVEEREIGMVFQNYALFPHMDVAGNVAYPLVLRGVKGPELAQRVARALETVQLSGYGDRRIDALSGGQRQRVALARAIVFEPRIVLMDEPLSALDKQLRERMQIELRRLHDQLGTTTIYVTHDQREALTMSDRIAVIHDGRIRQLDTPRVLYERPASRLVAEFIGESTMLKVAVSPGRDICICSGQVLQLAPIAPQAGAALLMLRPERLQVLAADAPARPGQNQLQGRLLDSVYQGDSFLLQAQLSDGSVIGVRGIAGTAALAALPARGETLRMGFEVSDTVLLADADA
jgi:putative spermidine/putrescine transport system ATP-binding protein